MRTIRSSMYCGMEHLIPCRIFDRCVPNPRSFNNDILRRIDEQRTITRGLGKYLRDNPMPKMYEGDIRFHGQ